MVVTAIPFAFAAASADGDDLAISGVNMSSSTPYLASGSKEASATQPETGYAYWDAASNTLTLNNFTSATDAATGIFYDGSAETLRIELVGNNSVTGGFGAATAPHSGVGLFNTNTNILFSGGGTLTATGIASGYGVYATGGNITVDSGTTLVATGGWAGSGVYADSITVNAGGSLTGNGGESDGTGVVAAGTGGITVNAGGSLTGNGGENGGHGVYASTGSITVNGGSLTGNGGNSSNSYGVYAYSGSITVNGGSLTGNSSASRGVDAYSITVENGGILEATGKDTGVYVAGTRESGGSITVNGGSLTAKGEKFGVYTYPNSISVSGDSHILATGGSSGNEIPVGNLPEDYYYYASGDGTDKTFAHSTDAPLTGTVRETYFELVTAQHLSDTYTSNGDATHSRYCSCALHTKVTAPEACSGGTATCIAKAVCDVCGKSYGELDPDNHDSSVNYDKNGFCEYGCYEPAVLNGDVYEISNAGQLYWFAQQVNIEGNAAANGKLMADIDLENRIWYPIGLYNDIAEANGSPVQKQYAGTFDGNNHTVSNFTAIGNGSQGLFGYCNYSSAQIKNLGVINATVSGWNAGAVAGYCANLTNCYAVGCTITGASDTNTDAVTISSVGGNNGPTAIVNCWAYNCKLVVGEGEANYVMHPVGGIRTSNSSIVQNCYYGEIVTEAEFTSTTGATEKTEAQFASGEVAYLLSGDQSTITFKQTLGTDAYPSFTGGTVYQVENCKGELGYSNTNENIGHQWVNGTCTVCEYACPHEKYTDGVCDKCGYECPHEWGEGVLTRPTFETAGYYTYTCTLCGHSYTEPTKRADDTALNDASVKVMEYIGNSTLTQEALDEIDKSYRDILKNNGNVFDEFGFVRGDLVEEDQPAINAVTAELEKIIADADEKIASGEYVKADYNGIYQAIHRIKDKFLYEDVTDEGKAGLEEIKKRFEAMKADENTSAADVAEFEKEIEAYEEELDKGIEDGTLVSVRPEKIATKFSDNWNEKLEAEGLLDERDDFINNQKFTDEALAAVDEIENFLVSLEGTVAENAENLAKLNEMFNSVSASWENCLRGTHNFNDYEVTSPAKCEVNAKETSTCWFCGETDEREVEGTALKHSYTKYEVTEEAECGKAGKEVASCDHGCGATDEKEIEALEHADKDGDYLCDHGCGYEFEKPVEPEQPEDPSENCDHLCHKSGIMSIFWKIIRFFYRLFNIQQYCDCGVIHYDAPVFG